MVLDWLANESNIFIRKISYFYERLKYIRFFSCSHNDVTSNDVLRTIYNKIHQARQDTGNHQHAGGCVSF